MPIQRLWCEGCNAPLPFRRLSDGTVEVKTEQCRDRHPALVPPWFPVRLQQVKASEEHRGLDGIRPEDWEDKGILTDPSKQKASVPSVRGSGLGAGEKVDCW